MARETFLMDTSSRPWQVLLAGAEQKLVITTASRRITLAGSKRLCPIRFQFWTNEALLDYGEVQMNAAI